MLKSDTIQRMNNALFSASQLSSYGQSRSLWYLELAEHKIRIVFILVLLLAFSVLQHHSRAIACTF